MRRSKGSIRSMIFISLFAALMCIGAWIHIPSAVPVTMQTYVLFCSLGLLGSYRTFAVLVIYIMLGVLGFPVFSGFSGGIGILGGPTAGFIWGFILGVPVFGFVRKFLRDKKSFLYLGYILYILLHYITGSMWYCIFTFGDVSAEKLLSAAAVSVVPFIIPDLIKMLLAVITVKRLKKFSVII